MPGDLWRMTNGVWRGITSGAVDVGEEPPPPPSQLAPTFVAAGALFKGTGAISPTWPAGHVADDVGLMVIQTCAQGIGTLPSGWAHVTGSPFSTGTAGAAGSVMLSVLWKRATTNLMAALSIGDSGDHQVAYILVFRGCPTTGDPWDAVAGDVLATASATVTWPSVTTLGNRRLVLGIVANATDINGAQLNGGSLISSTLTGLAERADGNGGSGHGGGVAVITGLKESVGATGTFTGTLATSSKQARCTLSLVGTAGTGPPPATGFRIMLAAVGLPEALWGTQPMPDLFQTIASGTQLAQSGGVLDDLRAAGAVCCLRVTGGNSLVKQPAPGTEEYPVGSFRPDLWEALFDTWLAQVIAAHGGTGLTKLRDAVRDGVFRGIQILDDFVSAVDNPDQTNGFARAVTFEEIERISAHAHDALPWMPLIARGQGVTMRNIATSGGVVRRYRYLTAAWAQHRPGLDKSFGTSAQYFATQVAAALQCGLGIMGGLNLIQGAGTSSGFGCQIPGDEEDKCGASPAEIISDGLAAIANPGVHGFTVHAYNFITTYFLRADIQAALQTVYNAAQGRDDPTLDVRGYLEAA